MKVRVAVAVIVTPLLLAACSGNPNQDTGTLIGAVGGGIIGNQFGSGKGKAVATVAGIIAGGIIGSEIGRSLDEEERRMAQEAEYEALEYGPDDQPRRWRSQRRGRYGQITPGRRYSQNNYTCREYTHTIYVDGRPETMRGKACRQPDGAWKQV